MELRRGKILCTLGPATQDRATLESLLAAGMNAVRINFSHGAHETHRATVTQVRALSVDAAVPITVLADLQGPKIRVGTLPDEGLALEDGAPLILCPTGTPSDEEHAVSIDHATLGAEVRVGDPVLMDDGALEAEVIAVEDGRIHCTLRNAGVLRSRKGVNLPQTPLTLPSLTPKDEDDLRFALSLEVDMIALSFVRRAADLEKALEIMDAEKNRVPLIAKIEKPEAVQHLDEIIDTADGVMVARGDLGVEMGPEEVPIIQKTVIERCNARGKLVITATQMLDSMIRNPRPTRAEASDVANAVLDGSDALMLSGETAVGIDPPNVVATMDRIIRRMERGERLWQGPRVDMGFGHGPNAIARSAVECSSSLDGNAAIVVFTGSGGTARLISDYRPKVPIIAYTPDRNTYQSLSLYWGVIPRFLEISGDREEHIFEELDLAVQRDGFVAHGSTVVMVMGFPIKARTSVNLIKLHRLSERLPAD